MDCPSCSKKVSAKWKVCAYCEAPLKTSCSSCDADVQPDWRACPYCQTSLAQPEKGGSETHSAASILGYCAGTGRVIRPFDEHFRCLQCEKLYLPAQQFEDKPVCRQCAYSSGAAQTLEAERTERRAKEEAERCALEEAKQRAKEDAEQRAKEEKERCAKEEAERRAKEQAEQRAKEEAEQRAVEEAKQRAKEDAEQRAKEEKERCAKEEAERRAKEETEQRAKEEAEQRAAEEDRAHAEAKAKVLAAKREQLIASLGISENDWAEIPAGEFLMGSPESEPERRDNERQHHVKVTAFKLLKTPVTFAMYDVFCNATRRHRPSDKDWGRANRPVINISYWDAVDFVTWLSRLTGWEVRLPLEAEWEYACRAGTTTPFWTGQHISTDQANFDGNFRPNDSKVGSNRQRTTPVDLFSPNPWGLYDMHGNVWEWCASEYDEGYGGLECRDASNDRSNKNERVLRGGSWLFVSKYLRSARRTGYDPDVSRDTMGFRLVRM